MDNTIGMTKMSFCYRQAFNREIPEAYQKLLMDGLNGDRTLFISDRETELSWAILDPFLDKGDLFFYEPGTCPATQYPDVWIDFGSYAGKC